MCVCVDERERSADVINNDDALVLEWLGLLSSDDTKRSTTSSRVQDKRHQRRRASVRVARSAVV